MEPKDNLGNGLVSVWIGLCLSLIFSALAATLYKLWWIPLHMQRMMAAQGIKGPPYKFIHGSTKEIREMQRKAASRPMTNLDHNILPYLQPHVYAWTKAYGKNHLTWIGTQAQLVIADSELIKEVLNNKDAAFPKPPLREYSKKLLGNGLASLHGEKWAKQRRLANYVFHGDSLKSMVPAIVDGVHMMLERWENRQDNEIEVFEEFTILTSDVISRTAFGSSYIEGRAIFEQISKLVLIVSRNDFRVKLPIISVFWKNQDDMEAKKLEKGIRDAILEIIKKREKKMEVGGAEYYGNDFLGQLVKASCHKAESSRITMDDIVDECKTFYFAGQETTNALLTWTTYLLAVYPNWQEEARNEVLKVFGNEDPDMDGIPKLKMINMILNESLRLYSPIVGAVRKVNKEVRLGKFLVPANMNIFIPILKLHHDREIWGEDVLLFKPERFSRGVAAATDNNSAAFIPFALGPRTCVGMSFAMSEAKIALSMILQRYMFELSSTYIHSPLQYLTPRPKHGLQVIFHPL